MSKIVRSSSDNATGRSSTVGGSVDPFNGGIKLLDATEPEEGGSVTPRTSASPSWRQLARIATQTSVKDELTRRKYAKWRKEQTDTQDGNSIGAENGGPAEEREAVGNRHGKRVEHAEHSDSAALDFGHEPNSPEAKQKDTKKQHTHHHKQHKDKPKGESAIDILYENQRGSWFCGIPLYSHSSLLQFDPAPWVNHEYKASAVNITNAQVPDPSWQWEWKHWYVDMSGDVDEDGWQYSFAFFGKFAWHGTHPWFHSFCRRRRWLRKRTKTAQAQSGKVMPSSMSVAHRLNTDYFTIHSKRDRSPSFMDGKPRTARPDSYMSYQTEKMADDAPEEINNIAALMKALRTAIVDRERIDVVKQFVELGGEELAYLKDRIPEIMHFLVFQNSKRQVLEFLKQKAQDAQHHREEHDAENRPEGEAESRRIDNLIQAIEAADEEIKGLEYWSDRQHIMITTEDPESPDELKLTTIFDKTDDARPSSNDSPASGIKGLADEAEVGTDTGKERIYRGAKLAPDNPSKDEQKSKSNGKGKAKDDGSNDENDQKDTDGPASSLGGDQAVISDEEIAEEVKEEQY